MTGSSITAIAVLSSALLFVAGEARGQQLPDGAGKDLVEGVCTGCHQVNQITRSSGYTAEGWHALTATMIDLSGDPETEAEIVTYLAESFPPNERRAPDLQPGDTNIGFSEWVAPTLG